LQVVLTFWRRIVNWANESLLPWITQNLVPTLSELAKEAFVQLVVQFDRVKSPITRSIKKAWKTLRKFLAKSIIFFERKLLFEGKHQWIRRWKTKIYNVVNPSEPKIIEVVTEVEISFDDLPQDVREAILRTDKNEIEFDFLAGRDKEMEMVA